MPRWIDVPAHRVLEVALADIRENYDILNADGKPHMFGQDVYRIVRKADGKLFQEPRFHANNNLIENLVYLEEV